MDNTGSITELKKMISMSTDLSDVMNYFFDLHDANKLDASVILNPPLPELVKSFLKIAEETIRLEMAIKVQLKNPLLQVLRKENLVHGLCSTANIFAPITIVFATDIKVGVVTIVHKGVEEYFRISLSEKPRSVN